MSNKLFISETYRIRAGVTLEDLQAAVTLTDLQVVTPVGFVDLVASNVLLDPDTDNLYFRDSANDKAVLSESLLFSVDKALEETLLVEEHLSFAFAKQPGLDSFGVFDAPSKQVYKPVADSFGAVEKITIQKISFASSVLNVGTFNYAQFNN